MTNAANLPLIESVIPNHTRSSPAHADDSLDVFYDANFDWFLQGLVEQANDGNTYPLTLNVDGMLLSGWLIGGSQYFAKFSAEFATMASDPGASASLRDWAAGFGEMYMNIEEGAPSPVYIHMEKVHQFNPGQKPIPTDSSGLLWRGKIASISGFSLGTLTYSAKSSS